MDYEKTGVLFAAARDSYFVVAEAAVLQASDELGISESHYIYGQISTMVEQRLREKVAERIGIIGAYYVEDAFTLGSLLLRADVPNAADCYGSAAYLEVSSINYVVDLATDEVEKLSQARLVIRKSLEWYDVATDAEHVAKFLEVTAEDESVVETAVDRLQHIVDELIDNE